MKAKKSCVFFARVRNKIAVNKIFHQNFRLYFIKPWNLKLSSRKYMEVTHHGVPTEAKLEW